MQAATITGMAILLSVPYAFITGIFTWIYEDVSSIDALLAGVGGLLVAIVAFIWLFGAFYLHNSDQVLYIGLVFFVVTMFRGIRWAYRH